jgi:hypothetical protein
MNCLTGKDAWARKYSFLVRNLTIQKSQKSLGPQIANPQIDTCAEGTQILKKGQQIFRFAIWATYFRTAPFAPSKKNTSLNIVNPHL